MNRLFRNLLSCILALFLLITNIAFDFNVSSLAMFSEITAAAEELSDEIGGEPDKAEGLSASDDTQGTEEDEITAPDDGQGAGDDEIAAPDDGLGAGEDEATAPDGGQGTEEDEITAPDDGQGAEEGEATAPGDGQGSGEGEATAPVDGQGIGEDEITAPDDGLGAEEDEATTPDDGLGMLPDETIVPDEPDADAEAESAELTAKAATAVTIYIGPKDPAVEAEDEEVIDLNAKVKKLTLYAVVTPEGSPQAVDWSITKSKAVSAKLSGADCVVTGLKPGSVTVTARARDGSGVFDTCTVTVAGLARSITVSGPKELVAGASAKYAAAVSPKGTTQKTVTWSLDSDSDSVATIDPVTGMLTAANVTEALTVMITATAKDAGGVFSQPYPVVIRPVATDVTMMVGGEDADEALIDLNTKVKTLQLAVTVTPDGAFEAMSWSSTNPKVAKVSAGGLVTGLKPGTAIITATARDGSLESDTCLVTVAGLAKSISVSGPKEVVSGFTANYKAAVSPKGTTNKAVTWSVDDEDTATIDTDTALLTAAEVDSATTVFVTATSADTGEVASAPYEVTVLPMSTEVLVRQYGITIDKATIHLSQSKTLALSAEVLPSDAKKGVRWSSTNPKVAKVDAKGVVTGVKAGQAVIRATAADGLSFKEVALTVDSGKAFQLEYYDQVTTLFADIDSVEEYLGYATARNTALKTGEHGTWSLELTEADDMDDPSATVYVDWSNDTYAELDCKDVHGSGHVEYALRYQGGGGRYDQTVTIALDVVESTPDELPSGISYPVTSLELSKGATYTFDASKIAFTGGTLDGSVKNQRRFYLSNALYRNCTFTQDAYGGYKVKFNKVGRYVVTAEANIGNRTFSMDIPILVKDRGASPMTITSSLKYSVIYQDGNSDDDDYYLGDLTVSNVALMSGERFLYTIAPITDGPARITLVYSNSTDDMNWLRYSLDEGTGKSTYHVTVKVQQKDENDDYVDTGYEGSIDIALDVRALPSGLPTDVKLPKTNYAIKPGTTLTFKYADIKFGSGKLPTGVKVWKDFTFTEGWENVDTQNSSASFKCTFSEPGIYVLYARIGVGSYVRVKKITITVSDGSGIPLKLNVDMYYPTLYVDGDEEGGIAGISVKNISSEASGVSFEWSIERLGEGSEDDDPVVLTLEDADSDESENWVRYKLTGGTGSATYRVTVTMGDLSASTDLTVNVSSSDGLPTGASVSQTLYEIDPGDSIYFEYDDIEFESGTAPEDANVWREYDHDYDAWENVDANYEEEGIRYTFNEKGRYILYATIGIGNHSYQTPIEIDVTEEDELVLELDVEQYFSTVYTEGDYDCYLAQIKPRNFEVNPGSGEEYEWSVDQISGSASVISAEPRYDEGDDYMYVQYELGSGTGSATFRVTLTVGEYEASADIDVTVAERPASFPTGVSVPDISYQIEPGQTISFKYSDITPTPVNAPAGTQLNRDYNEDNGPWDSVDTDWYNDREVKTFNDEGRYTMRAHLQINNLVFETQIVITVGDSDTLDPRLELEQDYDTVFLEGEVSDRIARINTDVVLLGDETYEWEITRIGGTSTGTFNLTEYSANSDFLRLEYENVSAGIGTAIFRITYTAADGLYGGSVDLTLHIRSTAEFGSFPTGIDFSNFDTPYEISAGDTLTLDADDLEFAGGDAPAGFVVWRSFWDDEGDWSSVDWDDDDSIYNLTFNEPGTYTLRAGMGFYNTAFYETGIEIIVSQDEGRASANQLRCPIR